MLPMASSSLHRLQAIPWPWLAVGCDSITDKLLSMGAMTHLTGSGGISHLCRRACCKPRWKLSLLIR